MRIVSLKELGTLSTDELRAVIQNIDNPIEVRRVARKRWNEVMQTQPKAQLYQTVLITPDVCLSPVEDDQRA